MKKKEKKPQKKPDWQHADDLSYESGYVHKTQNKKHLPLYTLGAGKHYERRKK